MLKLINSSIFFHSFIYELKLQSRWLKHSPRSLFKADFIRWCVYNPVWYNRIDIRSSTGCGYSLHVSSTERQTYVCANNRAGIMQLS